MGGNSSIIRVVHGSCPFKHGETCDGYRCALAMDGDEDGYFCAFAVIAEALSKCEYTPQPVEDA